MIKTGNWEYPLIPLRISDGNDTGCQCQWIRWTWCRIEDNNDNDNNWKLINPPHQLWQHHRVLVSVEAGFGAIGRRRRREARSLPSTLRRETTTALPGSGRGEIQMFSDLFLFRYGNAWTPWRRCSPSSGPEEMLELEASSEEAIGSMSGYSSESSGWTRSLLATTTAGRSWGPHGSHKDWSGSLRNSPGGKLRLCFLSGDQTEGNFILR